MEANCRMRTVVAKFGGTSLADAEHFQKIREIIRKDPDRRYIVVSAPGKRFEEDIKVTDLLLMCWEEAASGGDFEVYLSQVAQRFREILDGLTRGGIIPPAAGSTCVQESWPLILDLHLSTRSGASHLMTMAA